MEESVLTKMTLKMQTQLILAGEPRPRLAGAVTMPVFQSAMYETRSEDKDYNSIQYIRCSNTPNHEALHTKLAAIEGSETALVTGSGMAAITSTLLTLLRVGDHIMMQDSLYGGTQAFLTEDGPALGLSLSSFDASKPASWEAHVTPKTRMIYVESISNPLLRIPQLAEVVRFARRHGLVACIDNTFATPINFRPIAFGFDVVIHSASKYLNGHADICAGVVAGRREVIEKVRAKVTHLGGALDPHAAWLLHRALKTLAIRVDRQNRSAETIARFLAAHPAVARVIYPGLETHPQYAQARELFSGFGGMISFEPIGGVPAAERLLERLAIISIAPSLGGVESNITRPAATTHLGVSADERQRMGIGDALLRLSIGLEDPDDLIVDLSEGLA